VSKSGGERTVVADKDGNYRLVLVGEPGESSMIFVRDHPEARISGESAVTVATGAYGEAIEVHANVPPVVMAKPLGKPGYIPDYSDAAKDKDAWARAWLLLDVSATGTVDRVKFLNRAGYDLDPIAVREAFKLSFTPARDRANQPIHSEVVWTYEWPAWDWLIAQRNGGRYLPWGVTEVKCQKPGEHVSERRECSTPDLAHGLVESWIAPRRSP
jgi:hypothetical protein